MRVIAGLRLSHRRPGPAHGGRAHGPRILQRRHAAPGPNAGAARQFAARRTARAVDRFCGDTAERGRRAGAGAGHHGVLLFQRPLDFLLPDDAGSPDVGTGAAPWRRRRDHGCAPAGFERDSLPVPGRPDRRRILRRRLDAPGRAHVAGPAPGRGAHHRHRRDPHRRGAARGDGAGTDAVAGRHRRAHAGQRVRRRHGFRSRKSPPGERRRAADTAGGQGAESGPVAARGPAFDQSRRVAGGDRRNLRRPAAAAGLASYLLFDRDFCRELIALGRRDAESRIDEIRAFLSAH